MQDRCQFVVEREVEPKVRPLLRAGVAEHDTTESHRTQALVQSAMVLWRAGQLVSIGEGSEQQRVRWCEVERWGEDRTGRRLVQSAAPRSDGKESGEHRGDD